LSKAIHSQFIEIARSVSPRLADAIESTGPVRLRRRNDAPLDVTLCRIVVGQQLSTRAAASIWNRLVESSGDEDFSDYISVVNADVLRSCGLSNAKSNAMKAIVEAESDGILDVAVLRRLNHEDRSKHLTSIRGVGRWTADMVSLFYFGDKDVWPETDVTVWKTLERLTSKRRRTSRTAAKFAPHRGYLAMYMYRIADAKPGS